MIDALLKPLSRGFPGALDLADDAALVDCKAGHQLVIAKDAMVADVHFLSDDPPERIARKLLRVNLSDLAAMGASPLGYLTAIARPRDLSAGFLESFAAGLAADQREYEVHLLGGDTVSTSGPLVLSLTILGYVPEGQALRRNGARPGDRIYVSGTLGDAALGLRVLRGLAATEDEAFALVDRYQLPRPRLGLGAGLRTLAHAAIDVSDGLLADLGHIATESGVGMDIDATRLPLSRFARSLPGARDAALTGGDDYELAFTVPPERAAEAEEKARATGTTITWIGEVRAGSGLRVFAENGAQHVLDGQAGWQHF